MSVLVAFGVSLALLPVQAAAQDLSAREKRAAWILPLDGPVLAGKPVTFRLKGNPSNPHWDLGDGTTADGSSVTHTYREPGIYRVVMGSKVGDTSNELSSAIVRVHTPETLHLPQIVLDSDVANEIDDQHAVAYALFSELDVLAITTVTWLRWRDPAQTELEVSWCGEQRSYEELQRVLNHARHSGLPEARVPLIFRGANTPLRSVGISTDKWYETEPIVTDGSQAILAAARGASPDNRVWVLPIGPLQNVASALLQVREEGWEADFRKRIRVCWLGGGPDGASTHSNGGRDPWAPWVTYRSGVEFVMFLERPVGSSIKFDPGRDLYPSNPLGDYLKRITEHYLQRRYGDVMYPNKAMYDIGVLSFVIGEHLEKPWVTRVEPAILLPPSPFRHERTTGSTHLTVIHEVDHVAMKNDFFNTLNGRPTPLAP